MISAHKICYQILRDRQTDPHPRFVMHLKDASLIALALLALILPASNACSGCDDQTNDGPERADVRIGESDASYGDAGSEGNSDSGPASNGSADTLTPSDTSEGDTGHDSERDTENGSERDAADGDSEPADTDDTKDGDDGDASEKPDAPDGGADGTTRDSDVAPSSDVGRDTFGADARSHDTEVDGGDTGPTPPSGLSTRCSNGPGWTLFKFHWSQNSGSSPRIDVWDASCTYSYATNSACNVRGVRSPNFTNSSPKAILLTQSKYLRVRFSVQGINFSDADVYVQARSYSTTASTYFRVYSPLYGSRQGGLVDNDWVYDWYHVPWTGYLQPGDDPNLTAIEIYDKGGDELAVHAVELCIR